MAHAWPSKRSEYTGEIAYAALCAHHPGGVCSLPEGQRERSTHLSDINKKCPPEGLTTGILEVSTDCLCSENVGKLLWLFYCSIMFGAQTANLFWIILIVFKTCE